PRVYPVASAQSESAERPQLSRDVREDAMSRIVLTCLFVVTLVSAPAAQLVSDRNQHDALQHYRAGEDALHGERFDVAEREFHHAAKLEPLLHQADYGVGQLFTLTNRYRLAVRADVDACADRRAGAR